MMPAVSPSPSPAPQVAGPARPDARPAPDPHPAPDPASPRPAPPFVLATRTGAVLALLALIAWCLAWELWVAPTGQRTLALKVLPLLPALGGLLRHRLYTHRWLSLLVWLYVTEGLVRATGPDSPATQLMAWGQVALSVLLFVICVAHVRWRLSHKTVDG